MVVYRWSEDAVAWILRDMRPLNEVRSGLEERLHEGFEYRTLSAGRPVLLSVQCRWFCLPVASRDPAPLVREIDQFVQGLVRV